MRDFEPAGTPSSRSPGYTAESDLTFDDVRLDDYEAVLVLGGRAPSTSATTSASSTSSAASTRRQKWVFAICHGVQILAAADLVKGKRVTAYEHCRWEMQAAGGDSRHGRSGGPRRPHRHRPVLAVAPGVL